MSFEITPRRRRDGYTLGSEALVFPLWYTTLNGAISYARFLGRECGCDIRILNGTGSVIEQIKIDGNRISTKKPSRFRPGNQRGSYRGPILNQPL